MLNLENVSVFGNRLLIELRLSDSGVSEDFFEAAYISDSGAQGTQELAGLGAPVLTDRGLAVPVWVVLHGETDVRELLIRIEDVGGKVSLADALLDEADLTAAEAAEACGQDFPIPAVDLF